MTSDTLTGRADKAFAFAQETAKQQITLCTGVLAITLTFVKDIAPADSPRTVLEVAWILYATSVLAGVATLMALTGNIERPNDSGKDSIYSGNIRWCAAAQALAFVAGLGLTVWFGVEAA